MSAADVELRVARLEARCAALLGINEELAADLAAARDGSPNSRGPSGGTLHVIEVERDAALLAETAAAARAAAEQAAAERDALSADLAACRVVLDSNLVRLHEQDVTLAALRDRLDAIEPALAATEKRGAQLERELSEAAGFRARRAVRAAVWIADRVPRRRPR